MSFDSREAQLGTKLFLVFLIPFGMIVVFMRLLVPDGLGPGPNSAQIAAADAPPAPLPALPSAPAVKTTPLNGHNFTLPAGFTIELVAGPPLVDRPISAAFDEKGRLYVTDSSGSNEKTAEQVKTKPHRIVRLEDTNGDGTFDKSTVYVKNISLPEGAMWLNGSLYVAAPPQIWKFTDTNDDGVADKEEIWFDGKTVLGCANDLHGPFLGPDGWIYWTKGAFAKQEYTLGNGKKWSTRASHIFRARPDGTGLEPVMSGGMDNPVGLTFTPAGECILGCTFLQHPADGKRDGLIHAVYGGVWGKDHDPIHEHPWTSPHLMPVMTQLGPAAPAGIHRYESDQFGKEYENNIFVSQFNMRKVSRHKLVPDGSTYKTIDSDFVVSDNRDFHPTDVVEDADGSLLILDTGGWYKLCCPTSQLAKADVKGAIYRVRKAGSHKVEGPWGLKIDWAKLEPKEMAKYLKDRRPAVRRLAITRLASDEDLLESVKSLELDDPILRLSLVWAETQSKGKWKSFIDVSISDENPTVRYAALHSSGLLRSRNPCIFLPATKNQYGNDLATCRLVIETIARNSENSIASIIGTYWTTEPDRFLDHALVFALIELGDQKETSKVLEDSYPPRIRRAALTALDQMPNGKLEAKSVLPVLDSKDAALRETAWWIAGRHPEWGEQLAGRFAEQLKTADKLTPAERDELAERLAKFAKSEAVQKALAVAVGTAPKAGKLLVLRVMGKAAVKTMPDPWRTGLLTAAPKLDDRELLKAALLVFRALPVSETEFDRFLAAVPRSCLCPPGLAPDDFKLTLLASRPPGSALDDATAALLLGRLGRDEPAAIRSEATDALVRAKLTPAQAGQLAGALKTVGPLELTKLLPAFTRTMDEKTGLTLVTALTQPAVRAMIRAEQVKPILDKYPKPVRDAAETLYALLAEARKAERAKLDRLMTELKPGDVRRGQLVFNSAKAACASCHKIGYVGGTVGPDLRGIGKIRTERDLMEAIVFPSASFVRSYEPYRVLTADGKAHNGVLKKDAPDEIVLAEAADKEVRIARAEIEEMAPSTVSVMPSGLDQQLSPQDLADLIAFLKANK